MKMIQKWGRPTDFNAKKLKSAYFSPATQTVLQAVNMQFGLDSLVLLLVSSFLTQHFLIGSCVIELSNIVGASVSNTLR